MKILSSRKNYQNSGAVLVAAQPIIIVKKTPIFQVKYFKAQLCALLNFC